MRTAKIPRPRQGAVCPRKTPHHSEGVRGNSRLRQQGPKPLSPHNLRPLYGSAMSASQGKRGVGRRGRRVDSIDVHGSRRAGARSRGRMGDNQGRLVSAKGARVRRRFAHTGAMQRAVKEKP